MMPTSDPKPSPLGDPLVKWLVGFFGAVFGFLLLPRTVTFVIRRFLLGIVAEIVTVVLAGLLTEKVVDLMDRDRPLEPAPSSRRNAAPSGLPGRPATEPRPLGKRDSQG